MSGPLWTYYCGLVGLPGAGKSTVVQIAALTDGRFRGKLTDQFHAQGSRMANYIDRLFVRAEQDVALACQFEALAQRAKLQREAGFYDWVDEPIEAVCAHSHAMHMLGMLPTDYFETWLAVFQTIQDVLPSARNLVLLTCDREELRRRIAHRGRPRDAAVTDSYLDAFDASLNEIVMRSGSPSIVIDTTSLQPSEVASAIIAKCESES